MRAELRWCLICHIRIQKQLSGNYLQELSLKHTSNDVQQGYGIRVFKNGAWGFAHSNVFSDEAVLATVKKAYETAILSAEVNKDKKLSLAPERSYLATYKTPIKIDPFNVPLTERIDRLLEVNRVMLAYKESSKLGSIN